MMKAVILSGGKGTRLMPLTEKTPKPMLPINEVPHLEYIIRLLKKHKITDIVFSTGHLHEEICRYFGDGSRHGVNITYRVDGERPLGTAGAIKNCEDLLGESFLVINGDILTNINLERFLNNQIVLNWYRGYKSSLVLVPVDDPSQFGVAVIDRWTRTITRFVEKPTSSDYGNLINAGIYLLEKEILKDVPYGEYKMLETDVFPILAERNELYFYVEPDMYWLDIGTHERYAQANEDVKNKIFIL